MNYNKLLLILLILFILFILFILIKLVLKIMTSKKLNKVNKIKPIVILLDMDRTMIGDIIPQLEEYYIIENINMELQSLNKKKINFNFKRLRNELKKNLIRPYLIKFFKSISKYDNIEIFVYTASHNDWANILIPQIEKTISSYKKDWTFRFNKPFLTRKHTIIKNKRYRKSIKKIKPFVFKELKNKYNLNNIKDLKNIMLFDDTPDVLLEKKHQIKVPEYTYLKQIDYLRDIPEKYIKKYYIIIEDKLNIEHSTTYDGFRTKYHNFLKKRFLHSDINNKKFNKDNYWNLIYDVFKNKIHNVSFTELLKELKNV